VDSTTAEQLWALLRDLAEQRSITLIMVTHEPSAAVHCHQVFRLRDGRIDDSFVVDGMDVAELATRVQRTGG